MSASPHRSGADGRPAYVFFVPWSPAALGGVNRVVLSLAHEMQREGSLHPIILSSNWSCRWPVRGEFQGIETLDWQLRPLSTGQGLRERLGYALWEALFGRAFAAFCRRRRVVCVNPHFPGASSLALMRVMQRFGIESRLFLSFHGSDVNQLARLDETDKQRWRRLLQQADATITCSSSLRERIHAALGLAPALGDPLGVTTVHNGIDLTLFTPADPPSPRPNGRRTVLCVGGLDANKNQGLLLQAFARLAAAHPDVDLCLVGDGPKRAPLQAQAAAAGLSDRVRLALNVPLSDVARFYAQASAFVLPSLSESFGLVLLEAGAFGLPVVTSDLPSAREILTPGVNARLFRSGDADDLALQLAAVLEQPQAAAAMGAALQRHVRGHFRWSTTLQRYRDLLDPLPGQRRA
jgi:glycosyltransferase involved in cell wall biosynthesis